MKKLAGLIIILAVLVLGGYYGMGFMTERTIKKNIDVINQSNGLYADIEQYDRGWFSSDAKVKWRLHVPERVTKDANGNSKTIAAQDFQMEMPLIIHHGPFIFANNKMRFGMGYAETVFPLPQQYSKQFDEAFTAESVKPQLDLNVYVNYFNTTTTDMSIPAFKLIPKDKSGTFSWLGMNGSTTMSPKMDKVEGDLVINGMSMEKDTTKMTVGKISGDYDLHQTLAGLYLGDANIELPKISVMDKDQKIFELSDFSLSSSSDIEDSLFSTHFSAGLKSIWANGKNYGPGQIEISLRNLDAEVLAGINRQATAMQSGNDAERQRAMMALMPEIPKLFNKGAELEISTLNMTLPEGTIEGNMLITLPKSENSNPFELMQKVQGNAKLKMPTVVLKQLLQQSVLQQMSKQPEIQQALIQQMQSTQDQSAAPALTTAQLAAAQADKQISAMEQSGLISLQGTDYVIELTLNQGKLNVNGKPFDPSMMKF